MLVTVRNKAVSMNIYDCGSELFQVTREGIQLVLGENS